MAVARVSQRALLVAALLALSLIVLAGTARAASPSPPTGLVAKAGDGRITVTWKAGSGGTAPVSYRVNGKTVLPGTALPANDSGIAWSTPAATVAAPTLTATIGDDPDWAVFNGETYWISVQAVDAAGIPSTKNPIVAVVPYGKPGRVTISKVKAVDSGIDVSFRPNESTPNGSAILEYQVVASPGGSTCAPASLDVLSCRLTGLASGSYTVTVRARNAAGWCATCATSGPVAVVSSAAADNGGSAADNDGSPASGANAGATQSVPTADGGTAGATMAVARIHRSASAVQVNSAITTTRVARFTFRVTAKIGTRTVGSCVATRVVSADGRTSVSCALASRARAALRRHALTLTLVATAVPDDPAVTGTRLTVRRTQIARRG